MNEQENIKFLCLRIENALLHEKINRGLTAFEENILQGVHKNNLKIQ